MGEFVAEVQIARRRLLHFGFVIVSIFLVLDFTVFDRILDEAALSKNGVYLSLQQINIEVKWFIEKRIGVVELVDFLLADWLA